MKIIDLYRFRMGTFLISALTLSYALPGARAQESEESLGAGEGIPADDGRILGWAERVVSLVRGPVDAGHPGFGSTGFGAPEDALGPADALPDDPLPVVSLGDGGVITVAVSPPIANGPGPDLAVFENGFSDVFLELAFVEVSSDGENFVRFSAVSHTPAAVQLGSFGLLDPGAIHNLAGKHRAGVGTPFDLEDLAGASSLLDLDSVKFVRITDVVGSIDPALGSFDSRGRIINDPFPTPFLSSGFDLDAVAVLNRSEPFGYRAWSSSQFPQPSGHPVDSKGPEEDPDGDGLTNLEEYAFLRDPLAADGAAALVEIVRSHGGELTLRFPYRNDAADLTYALESSTDLERWDDLPLKYSQYAVTAEEEHIEVSMLLSGEGEDGEPFPAVFFRVRVGFADESGFRY